MAAHESKEICVQDKFSMLHTLGYVSKIMLLTIFQNAKMLTSKQNDTIIDEMLYEREFSLWGWIFNNNNLQRLTIVFPKKILSNRKLL